MHEIHDIVQKYNLEVDQNFAQSAQQFATWIMPFRKAQ